MESRPSNQPGVQYDVLVKIDLTRQSLLLLIRSLRQSSALGGVGLLADNNVSVKGEEKNFLFFIFQIFLFNEPERQINNLKFRRPMVPKTR